ncbi:MAG TPA: lysylphosphatidylglycerol synthase transmembrane domain-containing protein [Ktedonobacteraceae bacterium]|nr:lysylphosphatidylglycerol synthase transmembrane domain-containing protein [Ktedonobacteraceae bacterium]
MQSPEKNVPMNPDTNIPSGRLIKHPHQFLQTDKLRRYGKSQGQDVTTQPTIQLQRMPTLPQTPLPKWDVLPQDELDATNADELFDFSSMNTMRLMALSGTLLAVRSPVRRSENSDTGGLVAQTPAPFTSLRAGSLSGINNSHSYNGTVASGVMRPPLPYIPAKQEVIHESAQAQLAWSAILNDPRVRAVFGLIIGVAMLFLISRFIDISTTIVVLEQHLTTPQGAMYALLATASFIAAFSIRGARWRLFLSRICDISTFKSIQIFWVAVFLNFLLPVQGGELGKSLILKRIKHVPISQSLPTVAMDKSLDLMPALFIMAVVPFIPSIHMSAALWLILSLVSSILIGIIVTVALMAWNRTTTIKLIHIVLQILPKGIRGKIESFALGFVDSLLAGASNPRTFIPAILLTCIAITCDGLFAWFAFKTVGVTSMNFGTAIFGYTTYNMFCILPTPPGQVGSNELVGVLVFSGLLGFPKTSVLAMYVFSHPLAALIMTTMCLLCLSGLGITIKSAMKIRARE